MILLKNEPDLFVPQSGALLCFQVMHCGFIEKVFARPAVIMHPENVQESRFARARGAHYGNKIALSDVEIDVAQDIK